MHAKDKKHYGYNKLFLIQLFGVEHWQSVKTEITSQMQHLFLQLKINYYFDWKFVK